MFKVRTNIRQLYYIARYLQGQGYYGIGIASKVNRYEEMNPTGIVFYPQFKEFNVFWK